MPSLRRWLSVSAGGVLVIATILLALWALMPNPGRAPATVVYREQPRTGAEKQHPAPTASGVHPGAVGNAAGKPALLARSQRTSAIAVPSDRQAGGVMLEETLLSTGCPATASVHGNLGPPSVVTSATYPRTGLRTGGRRPRICLGLQSLGRTG